MRQSIEPKFRVWSKKQKTYDYKHPFNASGSFYIAQNGVLFSDCGNSIAPEVKQDDFVIEQSTGIKDKNGKMIYVGDLVEEAIGGKTVIWEVRYCQSECCFELHYIKGALYGDNLLNDESQYEVIGNSHENPELLEDENKDFIPEQVSLCENCWCMTHTIDGKCGKCEAGKE